MKRKDTKGRNLRKGEGQRKDGLYMYRYTSEAGVRKTIYSWKLVDADRIPPGKRACVALRDREQQIEQDNLDRIYRDTGQVTLNALFDCYIADKRELKDKTLMNYKESYNRYIRYTLGCQRVGELKYSEIKRFYNDLMYEKGIMPSTVRYINSILHPVLQSALRDGLICRDPTSGILKELRKNHHGREKKQAALTVWEQEAFIEFVKSSPVYGKRLNMFTFMLGTGCRIGEVTGLTWSDCDFAQNVIHVRHNLQYYRLEGERMYRFHLSSVKSNASQRDIPMLAEVKNALLEERRRQKQMGIVPRTVDGVSDYVFVKQNGNLYSKTDINHAIKNIVNNYNRKEQLLAEREQREARLLRSFSCHSLRHTFATRFCEHETNMKTIQEIMGHTDIRITMNVYAEATREMKQATMKNLEGKIKIS